MRHIISLTTIPPRFGMIGPTLASLLAQKERPEEIRLYLPRHYRRFASYDGSLPNVPDGVTIVQVDDDLGPATKVLYAARSLRGQAVEVLFCDDDHHYGPDWSARLLRARQAQPDAAVTASGRSVESLGLKAHMTGRQPQVVLAPPLREQVGFQIRRLWADRPRRNPPEVVLRPAYRIVTRAGYCDLAEGFCGVAIRPDFLDDAAFVIPPVFWSVDDVWLSGMLARRGVPIWAIAGRTSARLILKVNDVAPLYMSKFDGVGRTEANRTCAQYFQQTYGLWGGAG